MKSNSRLFKGILELVRTGQVAEEFTTRDVSQVLGTSTPFLSKHCTDPKDRSKIAEGHAYFIRTGVGKYRISPDWINV